MSKGKYASKRSRSSKSLVLVLALVTLITATVGGTLAWLYDTTEKVENTFTVGDITIHLTESETDNNGKRSYFFVPGEILDKDPTVTVDYGSEDCYLFIKIKETNNTCTGLNGKIINWTVCDQETDSVNTNPATGWVHYKTEENNNAKYYYYYRTIAKTDDPNSEDTTTGEAYPILVEDQVKVNHQVTKEMVPAITQNKPTLSFWAAAIQSKHLEEETVTFAFSQIDWPNET